MENKSVASKKIRKGDNVLVIAGDSRGRTGTVLSLNGEKAIVQGVNVRKKHVKRTQQTPGRIVEMERPVHISNLKICVEGEQGVKLKVRTDKKGSREYVYHQDGKEQVYRSVKKPK